MNVDNARRLLGEFKFGLLFTEELGWSQPTAERRASVAEASSGLVYSRRMIAQLAGVAVFEVWTDAGLPDRKARDAIERDIARSYRENLCICLDKASEATQSFWVWANRGRDEEGRARRVLREHPYFRGQPADLFISKLQALFFELAEVAEGANLTVIAVANKLKAALDVERVVKRFYTDYRDQHLEFLALIEGVDNDRDRRWYASIVLNRLMFVWFLQRKGFLDHDPAIGRGDYDYLPNKLAASKARGKDRFFGDFLSALFFEAFAKVESERSAKARQLTGRIPYLNGGLFLPHRIELDHNKNLRNGTTLRIPDRAFEGLFAVFSRYTWYLNDTPGGKADEIDPAVLGYIFEKYVNVVSTHGQKGLGAYYTRPEITDYLAERTIEALILQKVNRPALPELSLPAVEFDSVPELLARMDGRLAKELANSVLPSIKVLDPAVGSGAFLVAAMKVLIGVYSAIVGRAELGNDRELKQWLAAEKKLHRSVAYAIRRRIITDNLYGVDLLEEAAEIAKLRLFLALLASVQRVDDIEPLPNIDFNILPGNSLIGLLHVDEQRFAAQGDLFKKSFRELLDEKNRNLDTYRHTAATFGKHVNLLQLRESIDAQMRTVGESLNTLLGDDFNALGIQYEQATWDEQKKDLGRPKKRPLTRADIDALAPFHWGYVFDEILGKHGGFDIILTNPPWEIFKPQAKEFFAEHSDLVTKNKMRIEEFEEEKADLLRKKEVRAAWLEYLSRFPHVSAYFRTAPEYAHQSTVVGGRKTGSDLNLYKLFLERCYHLLRPHGHCGIVVPSGIYTDLGAKGLRDLLFERTRIEGLFGFENRKSVFEGVDSRFKFVVLTFEKLAAPRVLAPGERNASAPPDDLLSPAKRPGTESFPAAFMRHDVAELDRFPREGAIDIPVELVKRLSPDSHSVMEFRSALDIAIAEKLLRFPLLGQRIEGTWNIALTREFDMTNDSKLFETAPGKGRLPLYEGKMIWQFEHKLAPPRYWVDEKRGRAALIGRGEDRGQPLDYQGFRLGFRDIAASTNERTLICAILPPRVFAGNTLNLESRTASAQRGPMSCAEQLACCALLNSFTADWVIRQKVTSHVNMFYAYQLPLPRLTASDPAFRHIVERAARLICTTHEFDSLAEEVGIGSHENGATDPAERARLRAELDGLIAHLYGLTEEEFAHILRAFPLVAGEAKEAALAAYRA